MSGTVYNVVHIVTSGEYKTPLVAAQVFDRAQVQATTPGAGKPASVSAWIIAPMRELFTRPERDIVSSLKQRCPDVDIRMVGGIGRLNNWPVMNTLVKQRRRLNGRTIYHCRGESSSSWAYLLKKKFADDLIVLDIRGYTPLERFVNDDVFNVKDLSAAQRKIYDADVAHLKMSIMQADRMCTVSEPLRQYLISNLGAAEVSGLIPCCVKSAIPGTHRDRIREELNITGKLAVLYLGGTQKYQHIEDLVIPFIRSAIRASENNVGVFITQNKEKMTALLGKFDIDMSRIRMISVAQDKVGDYLTAMDAGLLLRAPSELNSFSQPVKLGEYLGAGLPVIVEDGTGDVSAILSKYNIGYTVALSGKKDPAAFDKEVHSALDWCAASRESIKANARKFVEQHYTWNANVQKERQMYLDML